MATAIQSMHLESAKLPCNLDSERFVLGACLTDAESLMQIVEILEPADFILIEHQSIYGVIMELFHRGDSVDYHTTATSLQAKNLLACVGGLSYLIGLECAKLHNLETYIRHVRDASTRRKAIAEAQAFIDRCVSAPASDDLIQSAENLLSTLSASRDWRTVPRTVGDVVTQSGGVDNFFAAREKGIPIPFKLLNKLIGGLRKGKMLAIIARPAAGKTAMLKQMAEAVARQGKRALVISAEMSALDLIQRSVCGRAGVSMYRFAEGNLYKDESDRAQEELQKMANYDDRLLYWDEPGITTQTISSLLRYQVSMGRPVGALFIDYYQLIDTIGRSENRVQELSKVSRDLVAIKKRFKIPIVVLVQMSRAGAERDKPTTRDGKECGQIEQDADQILLLWLDKQEMELEATDSGREKRIVNWELGKNRGGWEGHGGWTPRGSHGEPGEVHEPLVFAKSRARFDEDLQLQEAA